MLKSPGTDNVITPTQQVERTKYEVTFYVNDHKLKIYEVQEGDTIEAPEVILGGGKYIGWGTEDFRTGVYKDMEVHAIIEMELNETE